jgi:hypothetical protein
MGLAFNLETTPNPNLTEGLSKYFVNLPQEVQEGKINGGDIFRGTDFFVSEMTDGTGPFNNGWVYRWCGKKGTAKQACQGIFPTGEFIIRDITFCNGYYAMVGSYKATFLDLYGSGNHGLAWDGFLFMYRGFSDNVLVPFDKDGLPNNSGGIVSSASGAGILPMRMPYDILPSTNSTTTANMDDVGLYTVDVLRGSSASGVSPAPGGGLETDAYSIILWLGGTQGISNPVAQGIPYTNVDRIAFGMAGVFGCPSFPTDTGFSSRVPVFTENIPTGIVADDPNSTSYAVVGGNAGFTQFNSIANMTIKMAWNATANDTLYGGPNAPTTIVWRTADIKDICGVGIDERGGSGGIFNYERYEDGWLPNGTNVCTGDVSTDDTSASFWGYYPKRFVDIQAYSSQLTKYGFTTLQVQTPCVVGGDCWVGTDDPSGASPQAKSYPMLLSMAWDIAGVVERPYPSPFASVCGSLVQPPFMNLFTAGLSFTGIAAGATSPSIKTPSRITNLVKTDALVANWNNLVNSYFAFVTAPYEQVGTDYTSGFDPSERQPFFYFFCNGIKYADGTIGAGIFVSEFSPFDEAVPIEPIAFNGLRLNNTTTETIPIDMPNKWTAKCTQTRTFTPQEELGAKNLNDAIDPTSPLTTPSDPPTNVFNSRNGEAVGVRNNFPRLGLEPVEGEDYDPLANAVSQMGATSSEAVGAMGWKNVVGGVEPVVFVADSGGGWVKNPFYPVDNPNYAPVFTYSNAFQNRGGTFNGKIITDPNSDSRIALGASWDNDRDQWIFLFGNFSNVQANQTASLVSVTATFTDSAKFGSAYLDQTKNFGNAPTSYNNLIWKSFPMTNNLDGIIIFGVTDPTLPFDFEQQGSLSYDNYPQDVPQQIYAKPTTSGGTRTFPTQSAGCIALSDPGTISYNPSTISVFNINGSTGRKAFVWVDYILFDGADAVIATKLRERGMKVSIDAVEWFKRKIINSGDLNIKQEEIEMWMRQQQDEFQMMMRDAERMGRVRKRKKQVSAYALDKLETLNTDFEDKEVQEFMKDYLPQSRPPTPEEEMLERQRKGGYSPQSKSYYDEVFEN